MVTSNREPIEWLGLMADALLAQSAIDRLQSAAYELVLEVVSAPPETRRRTPGDTPTKTTRLTSEQPHAIIHPADTGHPRTGPITLADDSYHC